MGTGGQIFALILVLVLVAWVFVTLSEAKGDSDADIIDFEPQEGEDTHGDEDL